MKNADKMTPEELRALAAEKEEAEQSKIHKEGFLKFDLYNLCEQYAGYPPGRYQIPEKFLDFWLFSPDQKQQIVKDFTESFHLVLKKGARFVAFKNDDNTYSWFDNENYGIEEMDDDWANQYLENIRNV